MKTTGWIIAAIVLLWVVFGDVKGTVAGWFWSDSAAPWESVHAFYYPDKNDLTVDERRLDVGTVRDCRVWVNAAALNNGDRYMERGDYECGVGCRSEYGDMFVCRLTIE